MAWSSSQKAPAVTRPNRVAANTSRTISQNRRAVGPRGGSRSRSHGRARQARLVSIAVCGCTPPSLAGGSPLTMWRAEPSLLRLPVLGGEQSRGERFQRGHELIELTGFEALVGFRREIVGERLDALFDGATRFAQPTVLADQAEIAP